MLDLRVEIETIVWQTAAAEVSDALRSRVRQRLSALGARRSEGAERRPRAVEAVSVDDAELVRRWFREKDSEAGDAIVCKYGGKLIAFAMRSMSRHDAEEVVQEAFFDFFRKAEISKPEELKAWLYGAVRNEIKKRSAARAKAAVEGIDEVDEAESRSALEAAIRQEDIKGVARVLMMRFDVLEQDLLIADITGESIDELATEMKVSVATARTRLCRLRTRLTEALGEVLS